jgi:hypothetical protein
MRLQTAAIAGAIAWAVVVALLFLFGPAYGTKSSSYEVGERGTQVRATTRGYSTGLSVNGPDVIFPLAIPIILAIVPLFVKKRRRALLLVSGCFILLFCILGAASVGLLYTPTAFLLLLAALPAREVPRAT